MRPQGSIATALALSVCAVSSSAIAAPPAKIYVRADGSNVCSGTFNTPFNSSLQCAKRTIQHAINVVAPKGTVKIGAGTFTENVTVSKSVSIIGSGWGRTVVVPAVSAPNPCDDSSLCGGLASSVFLIKSSDVAIQSLTVDGDNPSKTGVNVDGKDVDARNGIIEDHNSGVYDGLHVKYVEVKNVFLRGINAASGGSGVTIESSKVSWVMGDAASVAIFAFEADGIIHKNHISFANDSIAVNHSRGFAITSNTISHTASGIHIDNNGIDGASPDLVEGNFVKDCNPGGFGVWLLAAKGDAQISENTVSQCDVGFALLGGGLGASITFSGNTAIGAGNANSGGLVVMTDTFGFGHIDAAATSTNDVFEGFDSAVFVAQDGDKQASLVIDQDKIGDSNVGIENHAAVNVKNTCVRLNDKGVVSHPGATAILHNTVITGNTQSGIENLGDEPLDATGNYWGSPTGPSPTGAGDAALGPVEFVPFLQFAPFTCD